MGIIGEEFRTLNEHCNRSSNYSGIFLAVLVVLSQGEYNTGGDRQEPGADPFLSALFDQGPNHPVVQADSKWNRRDRLAVTLGNYERCEVNETKVRLSDTDPNYDYQPALVHNISCRPSVWIDPFANSYFSKVNEKCYVKNLNGASGCITRTRSQLISRRLKKEGSCWEVMTINVDVGCDCAVYIKNVN